MSSINCARILHIDVEANRMHLGAPLVSAAGAWNVVQLLAVTLGAASLAACTQSTVVSRKTESPAASRQASLEHNRKISFETKRLGDTKKHAPFALNRNAADTRMRPHGLASFYTEGTLTASGEKFDTQQLTAAHRTLPFGTRLRVTNVATGRSVTVRVNDRGPFVPGRVVDVSYSAAESLGMVGGGIAKVKLDVVR